MDSKLKKKYVVLDVETNGLETFWFDLLSISIYDPYTEKSYNRFLPLEKNDHVITTAINGITDDMLAKEIPMSQLEFDWIIDYFNLENRTILTYGNIDKRFLKEYCERKKLKNFDKLNFYNFKHQIISGRFTHGMITKDNLCNIFGIENVTKVHSGENDCILEWKIFEKLSNKYYLVVDDKIYEINKNYMVPASYMESYNNFKYYLNMPKVYINTEVIRKFRLSGIRIDRFDSNVGGIAIEHLINTMLDVIKNEDFEFEINNKKKLKYIGRFYPDRKDIPVLLDSDGTLISLDKDNDEYIDKVNRKIIRLKKRMQPLIDYLKKNIFEKKQIYSQELVINSNMNAFAKCDLSTDNAVVEIKMGNKVDFEKIKIQLFLESNNRSVYVLSMDWSKLEFVITKIKFINEEENKEQRKARKHTFEYYVKERIVKHYNLRSTSDAAKWRYDYAKLNENENFNYEYVKKYIKNNNIIDLASKLEVGVSTVNNWLNGKSRPYIWNAFAICVYLDIDDKNVIVKND